MFNYMVFLELGLAIYLIFAAAAGKSRVFTSPYIKKGNEAKYKKTGRIGYLVLAGLLIVLAVVNGYTSTLDQTTELWRQMSTLGTVISFVVLTALFVLLYLFNRLIDKAKKYAPHSTAPRAAFFFDEEEKKSGPKKK